MAALSIFIDESGDFGSYEPHNPYYVIAMVFHDQINDINQYIADLEKALLRDNLRTGPIHTRPLLRGEYEYKEFSISERQRMLSRLYVFAGKCHLRYKMFTFDRKIYRSPESLGKAITQEFNDFALTNQSLFTGYDEVIVYYDDGQNQLASIVSRLDSLILHIDHRHINPLNYQQYRLAQVADLACCMELSHLRYIHNQTTRSEEIVFGKARDFKKNYYRKFARKQL
ncbi:DUF3800 domain-containing protein [Bifidobacterium sp. ESL0763]|uniref:DUF3800 domain-containing protein n=1 Tax=Bifidobacterium sp. ESL0763 TaxID=2983227 RepID=UPI0023F82BFF|nr:DUF3800 domain-containing protein [Bifidobacterium sp. ESL0763]MDF7664460.1 DUF3800 domain-containing protein [Bifidobacterium sp. ESL0763]